MLVRGGVQVRPLVSYERYSLTLSLSVSSNLCLLLSLLKVTLASVGRKEANVVTMSRGVRVQADAAIEACVDRSFDLVVVPGVRARSCCLGREPSP